MAAYYLAVDIGASSGRHILGHMENGKWFWKKSIVLKMVEKSVLIIILSIVSIWVLMQEFLILSAIMMIFIDCLIELHEVHLIMKYLSWLFQKL